MCSLVRYYLLQSVTDFGGNKEIIGWINTKSFDGTMSIVCNLFSMQKEACLCVLLKDDVYCMNVTHQCVVSVQQDTEPSFALILADKIVAFYGDKNKIFKNNQAILNVVKNEAILKKESQMKADIQRENYNCYNLNTDKQKHLLKETLVKPLHRIEPYNYFKKYKKQIDDIFSSCPKDEVLEMMFGNSRWARFKKDNKFYVVGIVYRNFKAQFLGVGYPCFYAPSYIVQDKVLGRLKFYCVSKNKSFGYFLSFRTTTTGKRVN